MIEGKDVEVGVTGATSRGGARITRAGRAPAATEATITLVHKPTGVSVTTRIPAGHYTKKAMKKLRADAMAALLVQLESAVARHVKAGRR